MAATQGERRNPFVWFAAVGVVVALLALGGLSLRVLRFGEPSPSTSSQPSAASKEATTGPPALARDITLLTAPTPGAPEVARAFKGTPVRVAGRLEDGSWYAVEVVGRIDALGWVPVDALTSTGASAVPVVTASGWGNNVMSRPTSGDLPNLVFEALLVRRNRLFAVLSNDGYVDLNGPFLVNVGSGTPSRIELPGKSLRPGDRIESLLEGEYVQRRASIVAGVSTAEREETLDDNGLEVTLEPDLPNDLEVLTASSTPELSVTVRNNSPIPLVGALSLSVRETQPSTRLLTRVDGAALRVDAGGTQVFRLPGLAGLDLTRALVLIDTTAINDSDLENDVYPR